jgi:hypothetical protein
MALPIQAEQNMETLVDQLSERHRLVQVEVEQEALAA